jgi:hypothetical protein
MITSLLLLPTLGRTRSICNPWQSNSLLNTFVHAAHFASGQMIGKRQMILVSCKFTYVAIVLCTQTIILRPDIIVCIDACFTQKRSTNPRGADGHDPPNPTSSFFLPNDDVQAMEEFVQRCRGEKRRARASRVEPEEDRYEKGMSVPVSVLDGCGESFMAADEKREKASTRFFTDTGLMALLCRHDRVLWIANLTSAGEKQHYALALLDRLFKHLPPQMTVGLLYDIGCQLERSCRKWSLLDESILSRITFAVAVFHAYGHQWPCQIIYHPRKCKGFGLSDGEGCERLWSSLKQLIPSLRVSGVSTTHVSFCKSDSYSSSISIFSCLILKFATLTQDRCKDLAIGFIDVGYTAR